MLSSMQISTSISMTVRLFANNAEAAATTASNNDNDNVDATKSIYN